MTSVSTQPLGRLTRPARRVASRTTARRRLAPGCPVPYGKALGPLLLLAVWSAGSAAGLIEARSLSAPWTVVTTAGDLIADGRLQSHLAASAQRALLGLLFGTVVGLLLALLSGLSSGSPRWREGWPPSPWPPVRRRSAGDPDPGRYQVESYLDHHANKLVRRFDAGSYVVLTEAMNGHGVGRGRGGVASALGRIGVPTLVAGVDSDRFYPPAQQAELAAGISGSDRLRIIESPYGHDEFLIETDQVGALVRELLDG